MKTNDEASASDFEDDDEEQIIQPIVELRASLYNLYNMDIFTPLPEKAHKEIISLLPISDIRNSRIVSRTWNSILVKYIKFYAQFSDLTRYTFLNIPSPEKLIVSTILLRNLSKTIPDPLNPVEILMNFRMRSPGDVNKLIFADGVSEGCKNKILGAYHFIQELHFHRIPLPILPKDIIFYNCKTLEITTKNFSQDEATKSFFQLKTKHQHDGKGQGTNQNGTNFPSLQNLKLEFYARDDITLYLGAHFFAASHYKTLRSLTLNFGYYLSDVDKHSKEEISSKNSRLAKLKVIERNGKLQDGLKKEAQYKTLVSLLPLMKLETLNLSLSLNEGTSPWELSLKMMDSQRYLVQMKVEYPFVLKIKKGEFNNVVKRNVRSLQKISIPCLKDFDCSILKDCLKLQSFSIGKEFSFNYLFFGSRGSLTNFRQFPALHTIQSISICVPLTKAEIIWLSNAVPANSFLVYGIESDENYFACTEVIGIVQERGDIKKVMMRIYMDDDENSKLAEFFEMSALLIATDYFHADKCGFTTFIIEPFSDTSSSPGDDTPSADDPSPQAGSNNESESIRPGSADIFNTHFKRRSTTTTTYNPIN